MPILRIPKDGNFGVNQDLSATELPPQVWTDGGGAGGSGVAYIRYLGAQRAAGGTISTITVSGQSFTLHTFTSGGTFDVIG